MDTKDTKLTRWHLNHGAQLAPFGGYRMPLWYTSGPIREHRAVLESAGLFDTSHMAEILIEGPNSHDLLQQVLTKDLERCLAGHPLEPGRATYGFLLTPEGHLLDDAIVLQEERDAYLLVVNAGMGPAVSAHLLAAGAELDVTVSDMTGRLAKLDLQGPKSLDILRKALKPHPKLRSPIPYFGFVGHYDHLQQGICSTLGFPVLVSRTGYTGEFGFELFVRPCDFVRFWEQLLEVGREDGLIPCGLGARDSLRAGAMLPLSHQDLGDWPCIHHPWTFALPLRGQKFTKSFIGDDALLAARDTAPHTVAFLGSNGRKVEAGAEVLHEGAPVGTVLTCVTDMGMDLVNGVPVSLTSPGAPNGFAPRGLACGFLQTAIPLPVGTRLTLKDKRREIEVAIADQLRPARTARMPWPDNAAEALQRIG